jgi:hypothetical protein
VFDEAVVAPGAPAFEISSSYLKNSQNKLYLLIIIPLKAAPIK